MSENDMFTIKDASKYLNLNINTLRYKLKKNSDDCDSGIYDVKLFNLMQKVKVLGKNVKKGFSRVYERYIILDIAEFSKEFEKYNNFLQDIKKRKRSGNMGWTQSAVECYKAKMFCAGCPNRYICLSIANSQKDGIPPIKKVVKRLLEKIGLPPIF